MRELPKVVSIPRGPYCYASIGPMDERGLMRVGGTCPYWERRDGDHAYCAFLDYETEYGRELLWDRVKVCGVNDSDEDYDAASAMSAFGQDPEEGLEAKPASAPGRPTPPSQQKETGGQ